MRKVVITIFSVLTCILLNSCAVGENEVINKEYESKKLYIEYEKAIDDYDYEKELDKLMNQDVNAKKENYDILSLYKEISKEVTYEELSENVSLLLGKRIGVYGKVKEILNEDEEYVEALVNLSIMQTEEEKVIKVYHKKIKGVSKDEYKKDDLVMVFGIYMGQGKDYFEINSKFFRNASC